jgi:hypothetical protein
MSLKEDAGEGRNGLIILKMVINMNEAQLRTIEQIEQFLSGCAVIEFSTAGDDSERYTHISRVLKRFDYPGRSKRERGVLRRYLEHTSGYSRAQVNAGNSNTPPPISRCWWKWTRLRASHRAPPAASLPGVWRSHLYNLRKSAGYQAQRIHFTQTRAVCNAIASQTGVPALSVSWS